MKRLAGVCAPFSPGMRVLVACSTALILLAACSPGVALPWQAKAHSPVALDAQATCPLNMEGSEPTAPRSVPKNRPWLCKTTRYANAVTASLPFDPLDVPWGIAYAYNCGAKARDFRFGVANEGFDAAVMNSGPWLTGRQGRGYYMETKQTLLALYGTPELYRHVVELYVLSNCAWHLRAVRGAATVVRNEVPSIPSRPV